MNRKAQVVMFVVVGMLLLFSAAFVSRYAQTSQASPQSDRLLTGGAKLMVESCIEEIAGQNLDSVRVGGLAPVIEQKLGECFGAKRNFPQFRVTESTPRAAAFLSADNLTAIIVVDYPLQFENAGGASEMREFVVAYPMKQENTLHYTDGMAQKSAFVSSNRMLSLMLRDKTSATLGNSSVEKVSVQIKELAYKPAYFVGHMVYSLEPGGAVFDPPIHAALRYDESLVPWDKDESTLTMVYVDENLNPTPVYSHVDTANNVVHANLWHFSSVTVCMPNCQGYVCGNYDGCGGSCGTCSGSKPVCDQGKRCICSSSSCPRDYYCDGSDCTWGAGYGGQEGAPPTDTSEDPSLVNDDGTPGYGTPGWGTPGNPGGLDGDSGLGGGATGGLGNDGMGDANAGNPGGDADADGTTGDDE